jgi:hypothetical protein
MNNMEPTLDLGLNTPAAEPFAEKFYKGKPEYAPPFYTINIAHVEHLPEFEVIGVNGEVLQVERGKDVENIPAAFIGVLKNAIASRQVKHVNTDSTEYFTWQPFPAIPYQIVEGPYQTRK